MQERLIKELAVNSVLIPVIKHMSLAKVQEFAVMSQGSGPIHVDRDYCANTPFKKPLVPGFMISAYISEMLENNFGRDWFYGGELEVTFVKPAVPSDSLLVQGTIVNLQDNEVTCNVVVINQQSAIVAKGIAQVLVSK